MTESAEALFERIENFLSESKKLLEEGTYVDAAGLDEQVRQLCETVLSLSQQQRIAHADRMQDLLKSLSGLGESMMRQRDAMAEQLRGTHQQKKAHHAYKIVDASDNYGNRDEE